MLIFWLGKALIKQTFPELYCVRGTRTNGISFYLTMPRMREWVLVVMWLSRGHMKLPIKALLPSWKLGLVYRVHIFACQSPFLLRSQLSPSILSHHAGSMGLEWSWPLNLVQEETGGPGWPHRAQDEAGSAGEPVPWVPTPTWPQGTELQQNHCSAWKVAHTGKERWRDTRSSAWFELYLRACGG